MSEPRATFAQYVEYLRNRGRLVEVGRQPWILANRRLTPALPPDRIGEVDEAALGAAMKRSGAMVAIWNGAWDTAELPWWWVACDERQYDISNFGKSRRKHINKGLQKCEVRLLDIEEFLAQGFDVYRAAYSRYGNDVSPLSKEAFLKVASFDTAYCGREIWGALIDGKLVAYVSCLVVEDVVYTASSKSNPEHLKANPNDALRYIITHHYLRDRDMTLVISGQRAVKHDTQIQDFLRDFGYRRIFTPLRVRLNPALSLFFKSGGMGLAKICGMSRWKASLYSQFAAVAFVRNIAEQCKGRYTTDEA